VAVLLGVARETVRDWWKVGTNGGTANTSARPDARVKVDPKQRPVVRQRVDAGETLAQVAADYGVSKRQVRSIVTQERTIAAALEAAPESDQGATGSIATSSIASVTIKLRHAASLIVAASRHKLAWRSVVAADLL